MSRRASKTPSVVLVSIAGELPYVHGPYSDAVALRERDRLRRALEASDPGGERHITIVPIERGPIRVTDYLA